VPSRNQTDVIVETAPLKMFAKLTDFLVSPRDLIVLDPELSMCDDDHQARCHDFVADGRVLACRRRDRLRRASC